MSEPELDEIMKLDRDEMVTRFGVPAGALLHALCQRMLEQEKRIAEQEMRIVRVGALLQEATKRNSEGILRLKEIEDKIDRMRSLM